MPVALRLVRSGIGQGARPAVVSGSAEGISAGGRGGSSLRLVSGSGCPCQKPRASMISFAEIDGRLARLANWAGRIGFDETEATSYVAGAAGFAAGRGNGAGFE